MQAGDTQRTLLGETNEDRDNCGDMELGTHSWKEELHVKGRQPVAQRQPRVARDNPVGLWQWVINTVANRQNCKRCEGQRKNSKKDRWPKEYQ